MPLILQLQRAFRQETRQRDAELTGQRRKPAWLAAGGSNAAGIDAALEVARNKACA